MSTLDIIRNYLENSISTEAFQLELYNNKELQSVLSEQVEIKPYTNSGSVFLYLIEIDLFSLSGELNGKDLLSKFFILKGVNFNLNNDHEANYEALIEATPSWLNVSGDYAKFVLKQNEGLSGIKLKNAIKSYLTQSFKFLKKKPKWLQAPNWPIKNNVPLIFVDQVDISMLRNDTAYLYIFFDESNGEYINIEQAM